MKFLAQLLAASLLLIPVSVLAQDEKSPDQQQQRHDQNDPPPQAQAPDSHVPEPQAGLGADAQQSKDTGSQSHKSKKKHHNARQAHGTPQPDR